MTISRAEAIMQIHRYQQEQFHMKKAILREVRKRYKFARLQVVNTTETEIIRTDYIACTLHNEPLELKVTTDKKGHFTTFKVEKRIIGEDVFNFFDVFEIHM